MSKKTNSKKTSSVRHTRAIQRDRSKRPISVPTDEAVEERLAELIKPAIYAQVAYYRSLGMRERILTLPVMVAFVLSLIWRQMGSVMDAVRELQQRGLLWAGAVEVSQQAVSERLHTFPAELFERVLLEVLPQIQQRWQERQRPLAPAMAWAQEHFTTVLILDGSTLDALLRKVGLLRDGQGPVLAGRMATLLNAASLLPQQIWYEEDSRAHDQTFWQRAVTQVEKGTLLLFDLGFTNYGWYDKLTTLGLWFITRLKTNAVYRVERVLQQGTHIHDYLIRLGRANSQCDHLMRLIEIQYQGRWYRYVTNVLDPDLLPAVYVAELYRQRWRIEDAFNVAKRLLGLAYFWVGSINGIQVQVWATWLLYTVLVDLTDAVAEALHRPFREVSMEMVFRGLYHFTQARQDGRAHDPIAYLVENAKLLGIIKPKYRSKSPLTTRASP
jgi:hypothetical protein